MPLDLPEPLTATPADPTVHHVRVALDDRLRALVGHEAGTRDGSDIEDLHQMRVAVRRMRATLKAARPLLDAAWADGLRAELGWLGGALGPVRDLDVMLDRLRGEIADLPSAERAAGATLLAALEDERVAAREAMLAALDDPRYGALLRLLADAIARPLPASSSTERTPTLLDLVRTEARKLRRAVGRAGPDPADEVLHGLRIHGKRLRYTGELVKPGLRGTPAGKAVGRLLAAAADLQEVLGDHQDACVAEARIRALLDGLGPRPDPLTVFVAGRLVEREVERAAEMRGRWSAVWTRVDAPIADLQRL